MKYSLFSVFNFSVDGVTTLATSSLSNAADEAALSTESEAY